MLPFPRGSMVTLNASPSSTVGLVSRSVAQTWTRRPGAAGEPLLTLVRVLAFHTTDVWDGRVFIVVGGAGGHLALVGC